MNRFVFALLIIGVFPFDVFCKPKETTMKFTTKKSTTTKSTTSKSTPYSSSTPIPSTSSPVSQWSDPLGGGKYGNPGARLTLSSKSIDAVHNFAAKNISESIKSVQISEFTLPIGTGQLTIKSPQIVDSKFG